MLMQQDAPRARTALFIVALLLGFAASYIKIGNLLALQPSYLASAAYKSELLPSTISLYAVQSAVLAPEFQQAAGAQISFKSDPNNPALFSLESQDLNQERAGLGLERAQELLRIKLKAIALREVEESKKYLKELQGEASISSTKQAKKTEVLKARANSEKRDEPLISRAKKDQVSLLNKEISELEGFLNGQPRPAWFAARVNNNSLSAAQREVETAKARLLEIEEVFTSKSAAAKAQAKVLSQKQSRLSALEKHLATALLASNRSERRAIEEGALAAVKLDEGAEKESAKKSLETVAAKQGFPKNDSDWIDQHYQQLNDKAKVLEQKAALDRLTEPSTRLIRPVGYWLYIFLWLCSLGALLTALFTKQPKSSKRSKFFSRSKEAPNLSSLTHKKKSESQQAQFSQLLAVLRKEIGVSGRILILGQEETERSLLSLRLAQQLSEGKPKVRLIDFDLEDRPLSKRMGLADSPGVSELLNRAGPAEEFFASLPGTSIQFASAGMFAPVDFTQADLSWILTNRQQEITIIDAAFSSPLLNSLSKAGAVVCLLKSDTAWRPQESRVLNELRKAKISIWGISLDSFEIARLF